MSSTATIETESGLRVALVLQRRGTEVAIRATALPSAVTEAYDTAYNEHYVTYKRVAADVGIAAAGEPPQFGAAALMTDLQVSPPPLLEGIGRCVISTGGTGSEWRIEWTWKDGETVTPHDVFDVSSAVARVSLHLES